MKLELTLLRSSIMNYEFSLKWFVRVTVNMLFDVRGVDGLNIRSSQAGPKSYLRDGPINFHVPSPIDV